MDWSWTALCEKSSNFGPFLEKSLNLKINLHKVLNFACNLLILIWSGRTAEKLELKRFSQNLVGGNNLLPSLALLIIRVRGDALTTG